MADLTILTTEDLERALGQRDLLILALEKQARQQAEQTAPIDITQRHKDEQKGTG